MIMVIRVSVCVYINTYIRYISRKNDQKTTYQTKKKKQTWKKEMKVKILAAGGKGMQHDDFCSSGHQPHAYKTQHFKNKMMNEHNISDALDMII